MKIITVANSKGGVGKSTLAANLAVESAAEGLSVLLVDADVQGSSMAFRGLRETDDIKAMSITTPTLHKDLGGFDFDRIIVDVGGRDSGVFRSAVLASDLLIIPVLPSQYDIWAAGDTIEVLKDARVYKDGLPAYILLNQLIPNTIVGREAKAALADFSENAPLLDTHIFSRVAFKNSISTGKGVSEYEPNGKATEEIRALYREVMNLGGSR